MIHSKWRGKLFSLQPGALLFSSSKGWWPENEYEGAQGFYHASDYCLGLEGRTGPGREKIHYAGRDCDLVEVLIDQKVWWVAEIDIVV